MIDVLPKDIGIDQTTLSAFRSLKELRVRGRKISYDDFKEAIPSCRLADLDAINAQVNGKTTQVGVVAKMNFAKCSE